MAGGNDLAGRIDQLLGEPRLDELVALYFAEDRGFAGHLFDEVGENPPAEFTTGDLLAITLLDVALDPIAVREILGNPGRWGEALQAVPPARPLWEATDDELGAANELWESLNALPGVGPTKAGKLLARKRPLLIPIYDEVVETFLRPTPGQFWAELRAALRSEARRDQLNHLVDGNDSGIGTLRALDVAIWMRCGRSGRAMRARDLVGISRDPLRPRSPAPTADQRSGA